MSFEYNVPLSKHSIIVGNKGATIKEINSKFNVVVKIPPKELFSTAVAIVGTEANVLKAKEEIEKLIAFKISKDVLVETSYNIPLEKHHLLIGSGGATIQNLQKTHNVIITIPKKELASNNVQVLGTDTSVKSAIKEIEKLTGVSCNKTDSKVQNHASHQLEKLSLSDVNDCLFFGSKDDEKNFKKFLQYLGSCKATCDICVFTISDNDIARLILDLHKSGVKVRVITDDETCLNLGSDIKEMRDAGIPVRMDDSKAHMHHKFAVLDGRCLLNGSFNWTRAAHLENKENVLLTSNSKLVKPFAEEFESLWREFEHNKVKL